MIQRVTRYFIAKAFATKGVKMCPLCDDEVIHINDHACLYCEMNAQWGVIA